MRMGMDSYGRLRGGAVAPTLTTKGGAAVVEVFSVDGGKRPVPIPSETIQSRILGMRGIPVMLDRDLAELYGVPVKRLNEQVRRNIERFPEPFMFQLTAGEVADLKSQIATSSWGGVRKPPKVFSEQGVAMLSAVLNSKTAVAVSIAIMDAFVKMRRFQVANREMLCRIDMLDVPVAPPKSLPKKLEYHWNRDRIIVEQVLQSDKYLCEVDPKHKTFIARRNDQPYLEGHHLIPLARQKEFKVSLDVYANIIGLCPNCHRLLHFGKQTEIRDILKPIYTARADRFHNSGFTLSKDEFLALAAG